MGSDFNRLYRFEGFEVDPLNRLLSWKGQPVHLNAKAFDLLVYMAGNAGRLLPKEELIKAVWGDSFVEDGNLTQIVFVLRKALTSVDPECKAIVTVSRLGYRFSGQIEHVAGDSLPEPVAIAAVETSAKSEAVAKYPRRRGWLIAGALAGGGAIAAALILMYGIPVRREISGVPAPNVVTANAVENPILTGAVSPDGRSLAYADPRSITIRTIQSGESRVLPMDPGVVPARLAWYPDSSRLIVGQTDKDFPELATFSILSGKMSPLRGNAWTPAISPDGKRVAFVDGAHRELWLMDGNAEHSHRILMVVAPDKIYVMFWSLAGDRIWYARVHWDKDKNTTTLETCDLNGGSPTVALSDNRMSAFVLLPGGRLIYAMKEGPQEFTNLWEMPVNSGGNPAGQPRRLTNWTNFKISYLSSTADGKRVALLNGAWQADTYIGDLRKGGTELVNSRRLTQDDSDDWPSFWTLDDQAVVFESNRNGRSQIFRQRLDRTVPELLSTDSGEDLNPTFGGAWIYFHSVPAGERLAWNKPVEIRRISAGGGASSEVIRNVGVDVGCASARPEVCVLARLTGKTLAFYRFGHDGVQGSEIVRMEFDSRLSPSFAVSADGSEMGVVDPSGMGNRIRRIPLNGAPASEVTVAGRKGLETLFPAEAGKGWFVSSLTPTNGEYLLNVSPTGESHVLYEQPEDGRNTWGIPSHSGKQLAFLRWTAAKNVWMIDGFSR